MKILFKAIVFLLPFVAMYFYASNKCVAEQHTPGFCGEWIALGMLLPAACWLLVAVVRVWEHKR